MTTVSAPLSRLFREPVFDSALEKSYCLLFINESERVTARLWYGLASCYWLLAPLYGWALGFDAAVMHLFVPCALAMAAITVAAGLLIKVGRMLRIGQLIGFVLSNLVMCLVARADALDGVFARGIPTFWLIGSTIGLGVLAFRQYVHLGAVTFYMALLTWGVHDFPEPVLGVVFGFVLAIASSNAQVLLHRAFKLEAIRSFRQQSICTPKQVLVKAIATGRSIAEVFGAEDRACVCICSDWRKFQAFTATVSANELAAVLEAYYTHQIQLLDAAFPEGNYFIDWIADELFAVGFATPTCDTEEIVRCAVRYARACLETRAEFAARHGAPHGLDVGISAGNATVGMLGPVGNKKATALGNVAGLARRLQTLGKELRTLEGARDRFVLHPALAPALAGDPGIVAYKLPQGVAVKDLDVTTVLIPATPAVASRAA